MKKLAGLKHLAININCDAAVADEVEALENDIRDAAGIHPNSPMLQVRRLDQDIFSSMAQGCNRRPSDHPIPY